MSELIGSWIDGLAATALPLDDRGLQYGDGLFETVLMRHGRARFLEAHLARLARGCVRLGIPFDAMEALREEIGTAARLAPALAILKIIVTRGTGKRRGYSPRDAGRPRRIVSLFASAPLPEDVRAGATLRIASLRLAEIPALAGLKHLNRLENVLAASEPGHAECLDSLLLNAAGEVIGGTMSNVFAVRAGRLVTPPVDRCGVAGVLREIVLREGPALGVPMGEQRLSLPELLAADEVCITNARIGVVRVRCVGEHRFPMNEIVPRLAAHIEALDA